MPKSKDAKEVKRSGFPAVTTFMTLVKGATVTFAGPNFFNPCLVSKGPRIIMALPYTPLFLLDYDDLGLMDWLRAKGFFPLYCCRKPLKQRWAKSPRVAVGDKYLMTPLTLLRVLLWATLNRFSLIKPTPCNHA